MEKKNSEVKTQFAKSTIPLSGFFRVFFKLHDFVPKILNVQISIKIKFFGVTK